MIARIQVSAEEQDLYDAAIFFEQALNNWLKEVRKHEGVGASGLDVTKKIYTITIYNCTPALFKELDTMLNEGMPGCFTLKSSGDDYQDLQ